MSAQTHLGMGQDCEVCGKPFYGPHKHAPRIVAECCGCLSVTYKPIDPRPLTAREVERHKAAGHDVRPVTPR